MPSFLEPRFLAEGGDAGLTRQLQRLLEHLGFAGAVNIDGSGDLGGDLLAERAGQRWVVQVKWKQSGGVVSADAVNEVVNARVAYHADRAAVVTNGRFGKAARDRVDELAGIGVNVALWDGGMLLRLYHGAADRSRQIALHPYQDRALTRVLEDLTSTGRALLILATGLGKTYVAGETIAWFLANRPEARVLVVAHTKDLVEQLERALWAHLSKTTRTQMVTGDHARDDLPGVTCATTPTALAYVRNGYRPDLVVVDEAHHVSGDGQYAELLSLTESAWRLGVTATPWRGDRYDISAAFGPASEKVSIEDGMVLGYLAEVKYRLFADNIDWDFVRNVSAHDYSIKELNAKLFLPGRDEAIRDRLLDVWAATRSPRAIVFCRSIDHAERMAALLARSPQWANARAIHDGMPKRERQLRLLRFRSGEIPVLTAVDILNEGVDVPDVNILCFARVTHSRRIFIQQLGRGLRVRTGKERVEVLDFVSDIRRVAAVMTMRERVSMDDVETLRLGHGNHIEFTDQKAETLMAEWIKDAASLETDPDETRLQFPDVGA